MTPWGRHNNFRIFGIFTIVEVALFTYFFYLVIGNKIIKRIVLTACTCLVIFLLILFLKSNKTNFDSISASVESVTLIILSITYFFGQLSRPQEQFIYSSPNFWIVLAIMIYLSGTFFLFMMANNLSAYEIQKYWFINNVSNIITNLIFCIAFLVNRFASAHPITEKTYTGYNNIHENPLREQ
ncbi:MAG: hypothetical protein C5B59_10445 [Bacteroidetes bacterium]|nr:MAG: hypothetical protein C5B59_10445 [Bacteroidota bacterium]